MTTIGWKTRRQHRIEIWFVDYNDKYYVISERRKHAHWVQNIMHNTRVSFTVNNTTFEGMARIVDPEIEFKLATEISNGYKIRLESGIDCRTKIPLNVRPSFELCQGEQVSLLIYDEAAHYIEILKVNAQKNHNDLQSNFTDFRTFKTPIVLSQLVDLKLIFSTY